ncbi:serine/threonine-protein kinase [Mycoplasma sp. 1018B]|uniref:serine/threonine-protein kinase n=1 Tax=Mycoplasma sp. 1018B TaxID=2967302 RepID=UPI00211B7A1F|nr:serine/threonine-protein kinase [Mycoplasma sp. 1018B]UUM19244.1 serine/threonine protein kinase [Mycoplasma sp. 1018B]
MAFEILNDSNIYKKYKVITEIDSGGFSKVYKIQELDDKSDTFYALKYAYNSETSNYEQNKKRFEQEIKIYKKIKSNYVARYIESFFDEKEQYIVMEFVDGVSLKNRLAEGKINPKIVRNYAIQIAEGLQELHTCGIIHRDIKSNNIMITKDKNIKIIDFGLALTDESQRFTQETKLVGSIYYMAPEICVAKSVPTRQSDIYALGVLIYEMLTMEYPFKGATYEETINKHKFASLPNLAKILNIPQAMINIIIRATAKDPNKRYLSMTNLAKDLKTCLNIERYNEKPLDYKKIRIKKSFADILNSKKFLWISLIITFFIMVLTIIIIATVV